MSIAQPLIAVVDDDDAVGKALNRLLRSAGLRVETFASGLAFLKWLQSHAPAGVVLDLHMPEMDGFEVQAHLAQKEPRVPVILITGRDSPQARQRALASGAAAYLAKPLNDQALLETICAAIAYTPQN